MKLPTSLANIQKSLDSLAKAVLENQVALDYTLGEQERVWMTINSARYTYIDTSAGNKHQQNQATGYLASTNIGPSHPSFEWSEDWFASLFPWLQGLGPY